MSPALDIPDNWSPEAKQKALDIAKTRFAKSIQRFYCDRPRVCDGRPHEGFPYEHARGDQWPPGDLGWRLWLVMSGRGSGKTRTGAEWLRGISPRVERMAMVGRRGTDVRATMVEGDSGLIRVCERAGVSYDWMPSKKEFTFANGSKVFGYSAEEPDSLRGPQHGAGWFDEPAHMPLIDDAWSNFELGLRLPGLPGGAKALATTTPLPSPWIKKFAVAETTRLVRVSTYANIHNLDPSYQKMLRDRYEGTTLGRQELYGEIVEDVEGALWKSELFIYDTRLPDEMTRTVISIDPAGTANRRSDQTGIIGLGVRGRDLHVFKDATGKYSPNEWAMQAISMYRSLRADAIVAEKNFGGDMVKSTIEQAAKTMGEEVRVIVTHASRSKALRAEPVVGLYEQKRVTHAKGELNKLETEMMEWVPGRGDSPNRVDALVHGATELLRLSDNVASFARPGAQPLAGSRLPSLGKRAMKGIFG